MPSVEDAKDGQIARTRLSEIEHDPSQLVGGKELAWDLHTEFDKLLKEVVGKPTYRKLVMP